MKIKLKAEIESLIAKGNIEKTESPWAFPNVLIPKKDGSLRLCVDCRRLNAVTIINTYPLPRIDDLLNAAKVTPYMTTIDLKSVIQIDLKLLSLLLWAFLCLTEYQLDLRMLPQPFKD